MLMGKPALSSWNALLDYCAAAMARAQGGVRVLFLDRKNFSSRRVMNRGTVDHAPVYPREIVKRALELSLRAHSRAQPSERRSDAEPRRHRE